MNSSRTLEGSSFNYPRGKAKFHVSRKLARVELEENQKQARLTALKQPDSPIRIISWTPALPKTDRCRRRGKALNFRECFTKRAAIILVKYPAVSYSRIRGNLLRFQLTLSLFSSPFSSDRNGIRDMHKNVIQPRRIFKTLCRPYEWPFSSRMKLYPG